MILAKTGLLHVAQIFAFRHRSVPKGFVFDGFQQVAFAPWLHAGSDEVSHENLTQRTWPRMAPLRGSLFGTRGAERGRSRAGKKIIVERPRGSSDEHFILRHGTPFAAAAPVSATTAAKQELQPDGDALQQSGELTDGRDHGFLHHLGGLLDAIERAG